MFDRIELHWLALLIHTQLERSYQDHTLETEPRSIKRQVAETWFIPLLTPVRYHGILLTLKSLELKRRARALLSETSWGPQSAVHWAALTSELNQLIPYTATLAAELEELTETRWRNFSGEVTCDAERLASDHVWREVLDQLDPFLILGDQLDQASLDDRIGRIKWGMRDASRTRIEVWDRDTLSSNDLMLELKLPSPYALIMGRRLSTQGCDWSLQLRVSAPLKTWLGSGLLPSEVLSRGGSRR